MKQIWHSQYANINGFLWNCKWGLLWVIAITIGCVAHNPLPFSARYDVAKKIENHAYWVNQSLYAGPFFDDQRYRLLDSRSFEHLDYLRTLDGDIILPPPSDEIIPVGTRVEITRVVWPTLANIIKRPLYTPRYHTWIYMKVARDRGPVTITRDREHLAVVPSGLNSKSEVLNWFFSHFSQDDPNGWLETRKSHIKNAILEKKPIKGMVEKELYAAIGEPKFFSSAGAKTASTKRAIYEDMIVTLENEIVSSIFKTDF